VQPRGHGAIRCRHLGDLRKDAAALLDEYTRQRHEGQRQIARSLSRRGALRAELRQRNAEDIIHALMSPEIYRLLVLGRGWTPKRYAEWLGRTLVAQLLVPAGG
jgi:hypothetical protein